MMSVKSILETKKQKTKRENMSVIITTRNKVQEYFDADALNQSTFKLLEKGLDYMLATIAKREKDNEENKALPDYFIIGNAVDLILTGEDGEFEEAFYVSRLDKMPSDAEKEITEHVFNSVDLFAGVVTMDNYGEQILEACNTFNWQANWKAETRVNKIIEKCDTYFQELLMSTGKEIISTEMNERIGNIVNSLKSHPRTSKYFDREAQEDRLDVEFYYQLPIYFKYKGQDCKALMDLCIVGKDSSGNIVFIDPIDVKTMSGYTFDFAGNLRTHRYDMQAAWYIQALQSHFGVETDIIRPFKFVVESTTNIGNPLVFELNEETLALGRDGRPGGMIQGVLDAPLFYSRPIKGFTELVDDYLYNQDKILDENPGPIVIDYFKGIL